MEPVEPHRHDKAADAVQEGRPVNARFVRGGGKGTSIVPILAISTISAAVVLFGLFLIWSASKGDDVERPLGEKATDAAVFEGDQLQPAPVPAPTDAPNPQR